MPDYRTLEAVVEQLERGLPPAPDAGFLGATLDPVDARLVLIPVPWEVTISSRGGAAEAPRAIVRASHQLDLEDGAFGNPYRAGIAMLAQDDGIRNLNVQTQPRARAVIDALERGAAAPTELAAVNAAGAVLNDWVHTIAKTRLAQNKLVGVLGGDHSSPLGLIRALAESAEGGFGILHFDAHHDLRRAYEGFTWSHASVFFNVMEELPQAVKLVQVGVRDYAREERRYCQTLGRRARIFYGRDIFRLKACGKRFSDIARMILDELPQRVYVSFDIDALDPPYCPSTGTPVPGGLSFDEACYLLEELAASGRRVIGFDLCEVSPAGDGAEWDANVGARILYKLCGCLLRSQGLC
jgi:agmatinase